MPDIAMCKGVGCPKKKTCYRFKATPSYYQSYFMTAPYVEKEGCGYYWKVEKPKPKRGRK